MAPATAAATAVKDEPNTRFAIHAIEKPADHKFAVRLPQQALRFFVRITRPGGIDCAICVQPHDLAREQPLLI